MSCGADSGSGRAIGGRFSRLPRSPSMASAARAERAAKPILPILLGAMKAVAAISTQSNSSPAQIQFLFSDANADMWTAGFVSIRMTNLDDVRLRTA